jgi:excisionase family DNA binding protein
METKNTQKKFLFQLTTEEFDSLFRGMLNDIVLSLIKEGIKEHLKGIKVDQPDTITPDEAAKITGLKLKSIYSKVCRLEMPALTRGRPLMFSRAELEKWMKSGRPSVPETMAKEWREKRGMS